MFFDESSGRVIKVTKNPPNYGCQGTVLNYLTNLENQVHYFADTLKFEGLLPTDQGWVIVTSQDFIDGKPAPENDIDEFFAEFGFEALGNHSFRRLVDDTSISVFDARPDNVFLQSETGILVPIDIQVIVWS